MELSPDLISACLALEKYLDNPNALSERELVRWGPRAPPPPPQLLPICMVSRYLLQGDSRTQVES